MRPLFALAAAWLALAAPALARPVSVEDLLARESFGRAAFSPGGRWLAVERRDPYAAAPAFGYEAWQDLAASRVLLVDLRGRRAAEVLLPEMGPGLSLGPFSPDGRRLVVFRLRGGEWRLGVVDLSARSVRWLGVSPELPSVGRTVQWLDAGALLVIARAPGDLPRELRRARQAGERLPAQWRRAWSGGAAVTVVGSGAHLDARPRPRPSRLLRLDPSTGAVRVLARGEFEDLEVSPDGRRVALLFEGEDIPLLADRPVHGPFGTATARRRLRLLDLAGGAAAVPCPGWDVLPRLLSWSPSGRRLLVFARRDGSAWPEGRFLVVEPGGACSPVETGDFRPELRLRPEAVRAGWAGETPAAYGATAGSGSGWRLFTDRGALPAGAPVARSAATGLVILHEGRPVRLSTAGVAALSDEGELRPLASPAARFEARLALNAPAAEAPLLAQRLAVGVRELVAISADGVLGRVRTPADEEVLAVASDASAAVTIHWSTAGVARLRLHTPAGARELARINGGLAEVEPARVLPITHPGPDGGSLRSWLFLPPGPAPRSPPLVVLPYPGSSYSRPPPDQAPGRPVLGPSAQVLAGRGYAVLIPSLPRRGGEPLAGLADQVLAIVDAAARQAPGAFDPHRLALWGHSFGGYAALGIAAQSDRFCAVIASAAPTDLVSMWGQFAQGWRINPADGLGVAWSAGWVESAQGAMGGPPWRDPERYRRNSPLHLADRIRTPVLLMHGDQDTVPISQAEQMFSALHRQGKDALLVTYWGEGHHLQSPAHIRDQYERAFRWLEAHLGAPGGR